MASFLRGNQETLTVVPGAARAAGYVEALDDTVVVHNRQFVVGQVEPHDAAFSGTYRIPNGGGEAGDAGSACDITAGGPGVLVTPGVGPHLLTRALLATDSHAEVAINVLTTVGS